MKRILLKNLNLQDFQDGTDVRICGWIKKIRVSKSIVFIEINDGSQYSNVQVIACDGTVDDYATISKQNVGAAITVNGTFKVTPDAPQPFEISADSITVDGGSSPEYPLQNKKHTLEFLRTIAHLRPRTNTHNAIFRIRSRASYALHKFFNSNNFSYVHTPIITGSDCEGAGEMFRVTTLDPQNPPLTDSGKVDFTQDFFKKQTSLTVSGQLEAECMAMALGRVYTFGPTFRAENSNTPRHAAEFWMIEPEMAFADLEEDMDVAEEMIKYVLESVLEKCPDEMDFFNKFYDKTLIERIASVLISDFARITYTEAIDILNKANVQFEFPVSWGCDLQTEHERYLTEKVFEKPVFVIDYPKDIKAFYMRMNDDGKTVAAMDLLVPGVGELIGGSQREERYDKLVERIKQMGLNPDDYWWYLDLRKYGGAKHAGFGLGFERLIMYLTGINNIRDILPFPRTTGSAEF